MDAVQSGMCLLLTMGERKQEGALLKWNTHSHSHRFFILFADSGKNAKTSLTD